MVFVTLSSWRPTANDRGIVGAMDRKGRKAQSPSQWMLARSIIRSQLNHGAFFVIEGHEDLQTGSTTDSNVRVIIMTRRIMTRRGVLAAPQVVAELSIGW